MRPHRLHRQTVPQRDIVKNLIQLWLGELEAWGVHAGAITEIGKPVTFIDRENVLHAIA